MAGTGHLDIGLGRGATGAQHDRRPGFPSERLWPVDGSLPELIRESLAALEEAERRRSAQTELHQPGPDIRVVK